MFGSRRSAWRQQVIHSYDIDRQATNILLFPSRTASAAPSSVVFAVAHCVLVGMVGRLRRPLRPWRLRFWSSVCAMRVDLIVLKAPLYVMYVRSVKDRRM